MANSTPEKLLLTPQQAADALAISLRKLQLLTKAGDVPHVRIGRAPRYPVEDLRRWIDAQKIGGDS